MRTTLIAAVLAVLIGWRAHPALAQEKARPDATPAPGTPTVLPRPDFHFQGNVGRTYKDSDPAQFPQPVQAPKGAPNIVLILIDDTGFGQFSTFGGGVPSPTMDKLAAEGLRFNRSFEWTSLTTAGASAKAERRVFSSTTRRSLKAGSRSRVLHASGQRASTSAWTAPRR
jgi:arylsulfatase